jgi:hypothetical protein
MNGLLGLGQDMFRASKLTGVLIPSTITSYGLIVVVIFILNIIIIIMITRFWCILWYPKPHQCCVNEWPLRIGAGYVKANWIDECDNTVYNYVYWFYRIRQQRRFELCLLARGWDHHHPSRKYFLWFSKCKEMLLFSNWEVSLFYSNYNYYLNYYIKK